MTTQDRDRLKVLHEVKKKHITQREAAEQLGLSRRWVRKLVRRLGKEGDRGVIHRLRGKASNRKIALKVRQNAVQIVRAEYGDFGPTLAAEYLGEQHDIAVGKETLRKWMIEDGIWKPKLAQVENVHVWRPRRSCLGELVQWDTSEHDWLEGRGEKLYLIAMLDDATSRGLARFVRHDSTEENMLLMWRYLERWGRSFGYYTDKASLFYNTPKANHHKDAPELGPTQIGRALQELGIELITAHSPQAKGRIERFFGGAGPAGEGTAEGGSAKAGRGKSVSGGCVSTDVEQALHAGSAELDRCASAVNEGAQPSGDSELCGNAGGD